MKVCVLGGGRQGRVIAAALAPHADVTLADAHPVRVPAVRSLETDLSEPATLVRLIRGFDLAVGALPARLGTTAARAAIEAGRNYIDIAFTPGNPRDLDAEARKAGVTIVPDCGLAPGLSNLIAGRALARGTPDEIHIKVGGFAADPDRPYGYVVTWSPENLLEEYTRPARIVREGRVMTVPALSGLERVKVDGIGELEAFFTDGLRTLLDCGVRNMTEKTLRWPGHAGAIRPLLEGGRFSRKIQERCGEGEDLVVLLVDVVRGGNRFRTTLIDRPRDGLTAMARTTGYTCAAFARWALEGGLPEPGVVPPERIGADPKAFEFIRRALAGRGITFSDSGTTPSTSSRRP